MSKNTMTPVGSDPITDELMQSGLLAVMVTAQVAGLIFVFQLVAPDFPAFAISLLVFVVCLEALATTRWLAQRDQMLIDNTLYRCAEIITIFVSVRLVVWMAHDEFPALREMADYIVGPTLLFFDWDFFLALAVVAIAWVRACHFGGVFRELGVSEEEASLYALYRSNPSDFPAGPPVDRNRSAIARDFQRGWAWGGVFLVVCVTLASFDLVEVGAGEPPAPAYLSLAVLVYFLSGLWLASAARHNALNAKWLLTGTSRRSAVVRGWRRSTAWLIGGIAVAASFLPAGTILPIAEALHFLVNGVLFLAHFVLLMFVLLMAALTGLFGSSDDLAIDEDGLPGGLLPEVPGATQLFAPEAVITPVDLEPLLWLLLVGLVALAFAYFLHERWQSWPRIFRKVLGSLFSWFTRGKQPVSGTRSRSVSTSENQTGEKVARGGKRRRRKRLLIGLSGAAQIRELYRRVLDAAGKRDISRGPGQTPLEYERVLEARLPGESALIRELTEAFHLARYARGEIAGAQVRGIKRVYRRLRRRLRKG